MKFDKINNFKKPRSLKPPNKWPKWQIKRKELIWISRAGIHHVIYQMDNYHLRSAVRWINYQEEPNRVWCEHKLSQWKQYFLKELKYREKILGDTTVIWPQ